MVRLVKRSHELLACLIRLRFDALIYLGSLCVLVYASNRLGPSLGELTRLAHADRAAALVERAAAHGAAALIDETALAAYQGFASSPPALLFGAWMKLSLGRLGLLDLLTAQRAAWILLAAAGPWALYRLLRQPLGIGVALCAAALWLFTPRWLGAAVSGEPGAILGALWMLVTLIYLHARSAGKSFPGATQRRAQRTLPALGAACAFGVAVNVSLGALWLLPLLLLHEAVAHWRPWRRMLRRGLLPVPTAWVTMLVGGGLIALLSCPQLYTGGAAGALGFVLKHLNAEAATTLYLGSASDPEQLPTSFAAYWILATTPAFILLWALTGLWRVWLTRGRASSGGLRQLGGVGLAYTTVIAMFAPPHLMPFPPYSQLALGYLAMLAGFGLAWARRQFGSHGWWVLAATVSSAALAALLPVSSSGGAYSLLLGGSGGLVERRTFALDGSEIAAALPELEALGRDPLVLGTQYPQALFDRLRQSGRLSIQIQARPPGQGEVELARGETQGQVAVKRGRAVIWSLTEP